MCAKKHIYKYVCIYIYVQGAGNFAELCSETARGISSSYARNSRITVGFSRDWPKIEKLGRHVRELHTLFRTRKGSASRTHQHGWFEP